MICMFRGGSGYSILLFWYDTFRLVNPFLKSKRSFDIAYTIEDNIFKRNKVQLQIEDIRPNGE